MILLAVLGLIAAGATMVIAVFRVQMLIWEWHGRTTGRSYSMHEIKSRSLTVALVAAAGAAAGAIVAYLEH